MNYYYLDSLRYSDDFSEPHFFMGTKGNMIYLPTEAITREFKKYSIKTAEGIFQLDGEKGSWQRFGSKSLPIDKLNTWNNAQLIYTELGVYPEKTLGTPCDYAWISEE